MSVRKYKSEYRLRPIGRANFFSPSFSEEEVWRAQAYRQHVNVGDTYRVHGHWGDAMAGAEGLV